MVSIKMSSYSTISYSVKRRKKYPLKKSNNPEIVRSCMYILRSTVHQENKCPDTRARKAIGHQKYYYRTYSAISRVTFPQTSLNLGRFKAGL